MKTGFGNRFCVFAVILFLLNCVPFDNYEESEILNISNKQTMNSISNNQTNNQYYFDLGVNMSQYHDFIKGEFNLNSDLNSSTILLSYRDQIGTSSNSQGGLVTFNLTSNQSIGTKSMSDVINDNKFEILQNGSIVYNSGNFNSNNNRWYYITYAHENLTYYQSNQIQGKSLISIESGENETSVIEYTRGCYDANQQQVCKSTDNIASMNYSYSQNHCGSTFQSGGGDISKQILINETMLFFNAYGYGSCSKKTISANPDNGTNNWIQESSGSEYILGYSEIHGLIISNTSSNTWQARDVLTGNFTNQTFANNISVGDAQYDLFDYVDNYGRWYYGDRVYNPLTGNYTQFPFSSGSGNVNAQGSLLDVGPGMSALVAYPNGTVALYIMDEDEDGVLSYPFATPGDQCLGSPVILNWTDMDQDGCEDVVEDDDDDNDGILDSVDVCSVISTGPDYDQDGCQDFFDFDDDNDGRNDTIDDCPTGMTGWDSNNTTLDYDSDGCNDQTEDSDDDNDNIPDLNDLCQLGSLNRSLNLNWTDNDFDGCDDIAEDLDDDNDGTNDAQDFWPNDPEAYGADTDGDLLPNEIHLINENITMDYTFQYLHVPWLYPILDDYPKVDFGFNQNWMISSILNSTSPIAFAESPIFPTNIVQNNPALFFNFRGEGTIEVEYFKDNIDCKFDIHVDGYTFSMSDGWNNFSQIVGFGNHNIQFDYYENYSYSDCDSTSLQLYRILLPLAGETDAGLQADEDDDDDGYLDYNETSGVCLILSSPVDNQSIPPDVDADYICDALDNDIDGDGFNNSNDAFPYDVNATIDSDNDGMPDVINGNSTTGLFEDMDDDNDGFNDSIDPWPLDNCVGEDHDSDGLSDNVVLGCQTNILEDGDDDNDNKLDQDDFCPTGKLNWLSGAVTDIDGDGCRDSDEDLDDDNDGLLDTVDLCPQGYVGWISNPSVDQDSDGCHDLIEDNDDDNDGVTEPGDQCPNTPANVTVDSQGCPIDTDSDGVADYLDNCVNTPVGVVVDSNGCPVDTDGDGVPEYLDEFPLDPSETTDSDGDGVGDNSDAFPNDASETLDSDGDGVGDHSDAFPSDASETLDADGDGVGDNSDAFPSDANETIDSDSDGKGDNSDAFPSDANETMDTDGDGVGDNSDVFPSDANETIDSDGDGVGDNLDSFPSDASETLDSDSDGVGDNSDAFPSDANETMDTDGDGVGNNSDAYPDDASRTVKEESSSLMFVLIIVFLCLAGVGSVLFKRNSSSEKKIIPLEAPVESIEEQISEAQTEHVETPEVSKTPESPSITETGVTGDDGYEWLEFPEGSGGYFYRLPGENQWEKWDN